MANFNQSGDPSYYTNKKIHMWAHAILKLIQQYEP